MPQVDQIQIGTTTYEILQSSDATFTGTSNDVADASASSWTSVAALSSSETNGSIFTKISSMFKNIRFLYKRLGTSDISSLGSTVTAAITSLNTNKAAKDHTHDTSSLKTASGAALISTSQTSDDSRVPSAKLVYNMNTILSEINNERSSYVTKLGITNNSTITLYHVNTSVSSGTLTTATTANAGLLPKLNGSATRCLLGNGTWGTVGSTYANFSSAAAGLTPAASSGGSSIATSAYVLTGAGWRAGTKYNTDTSYSAATASANGLMTSADKTKLNGITAGATSYGTFTSAANGLVPAAKSGTTSYLTTGYVLTGGGWRAGTKYNTDTDTTYGTNVGCYGTLNGTTLTLNTRNFRV